MKFVNLTLPSVQTLSNQVREAESRINLLAERIERARQLDDVTLADRLLKVVAAEQQQLESVKTTELPLLVERVVDRALSVCKTLSESVETQKGFNYSRTADDTFKAKMLEAKELLASINNKIVAFAARQQSEQTNWGYPGTMEQVVKQLAELDEFLR